MGRHLTVTALVSEMRIASVGMTAMMLIIGIMIVVVMSKMIMLVLMTGLVMMMTMTFDMQ